MEYSSNEKTEHRTMKEKTLQYLLNKLGDKVIEYHSEKYIKRGNDSWMKSDLYIETKESIIIIEVKTSRNRQGLLQLLYQSRNIKTDKEIILILACNRIGKTELRNFVQRIDDEELKRFKCFVFDKDYNSLKEIKSLMSYKIKLNIA